MDGRSKSRSPSKPSKIQNVIKALVKFGPMSAVDLAQRVGIARVREIKKYASSWSARGWVTVDGDVFSVGPVEYVPEKRDLSPTMRSKPRIVALEKLFGDDAEHTKEELLAIAGDDMRSAKRNLRDWLIAEWIVPTSGESYKAGPRLLTVMRAEVVIADEAAARQKVMDRLWRQDLRPDAVAEMLGVSYDAARDFMNSICATEHATRVGFEYTLGPAAARARLYG